MATQPQSFTLSVPDEAIADLRERLARTRYPDQAPGAPWAYGTDIGYLQQLVGYWRTTFDWRAEEARLNAFPQYKVPLCGIDLHFLHVPGKGPAPCPLLLLHGWPGSVFEFLEDWNALTERIGFWIDLDDAYRTLDNDYIESVWWALRQIWDRGLLVETHKVVPYCPRDQTALSSHEVSLGYEDVVDPSVYVKFPVVEPHGPLQPGDVLLVWTTTPWTLVSNAAVAVDPALTYVRARADGATYVVAEALLERVLGEGAEILDRFPGRELVGTRYEPPFPYITDYGEKGHSVLAGDFVSTDPNCEGQQIGYLIGTGILSVLAHGQTFRSNGGSIPTPATTERRPAPL